MAETNLAPRLADVARHFRGEPDLENPTAGELTWGSLRVDTNNDTWVDHKINKGGGVMELVLHELWDDEAGALKWLEQRGWQPDSGPATQNLDANDVAAREGLDKVREAFEWRRDVPTKEAPRPFEHISADMTVPPTNGEPSEDLIALAFTLTFRDTMKFDCNAGKWFEWTGTCWQQDDRARAFHYARNLTREIGEQKRVLCKASVAAGAERFARSDPAHAVTAGIWDSDPLMLGTPLAHVDLRTGEHLAPEPSRLITKTTSVSPMEGRPLRWLTFLAEALAGDNETIGFLKRWSGYCLTGLTSEHTLLFIYGPGGNGKSVFLNTLQAIIADYAVTAAMETFVASRNDRHATELAMLRGARLVTASETEDGRKWADAKVKQMTGGDPITARFMRQDFFTFQPQFKLLIAGNHMPSLSNVDDAMKRRLAIVPFVHKPEHPDRQLEEKLRAEYGQILSWMIEGCLEWQERGLERPESVYAATAAYFDDQDVFGQWLEERCDLDPAKWELPAKLFADWSAYAKAAGEDPGSTKSFKPKLERHGLRWAKTMGLRVYRGISLKTEEEGR